MFSLKHKLPIWLMGALVFAGTMVEWFFWDPVHGKALITGAHVNVPGVLMLGVPVIIGWLYLMFGKDQLKPRLHWFWTPFGLLIIVWAWLTVWNTGVLEKGLTFNTFITATPELYRSTTFGLLIAFYSLASAEPLWYFYWTWGLAGIVMYSAEVPKLFGFAGVPWSPYLPPEQAGKFWNYWGYFFLDAYSVPLSFVVLYYIIKWRKGVLEKEGERHPLFWGFWEGIGLPFVLIWRGLKKVLRK